MVRAKFKVTNISRSEHWDKAKGEIQTIRLSPVIGGSEENAAFFAATPSGQIDSPPARGDEDGGVLMAFRRHTTATVLRAIELYGASGQRSRPVRVAHRHPGKCACQWRRSIDRCESCRHEEIAAALGVSAATVSLDLKRAGVARTYLPRKRGATPQSRPIEEGRTL